MWHFHYFLVCKYCVSLRSLNVQPSVINRNSYTSSSKNVPWTCIIKYGRKTNTCCINGIERDLRITALRNQYKARRSAYPAVMKSSIENKSSETRERCSYVLYKPIDRLGIIVSRRGKRVLSLKEMTLQDNILCVKRISGYFSRPREIRDTLQLCVITMILWKRAVFP